MKVELEYTIKKRMVVECDEYDKAVPTLYQSDWANGGSIIERKPEITSRLVIDDEIGEYHRSDGCIHLKPEVLAQPEINRIESIQEWSALLKERTDEILKISPNFTQEKAKYIAKQDMPDLPKDGWM